MMAVWLRSEPFSATMPAAFWMRNTQPGSVLWVTRILPVVSIDRSGCSTTKASPTAVPWETPVPVMRPGAAGRSVCRPWVCFWWICPS